MKAEGELKEGRRNQEELKRKAKKENKKENLPTAFDKIFQVDS